MEPLQTKIVMLYDAAGAGNLEEVKQLLKQFGKTILDGCGSGRGFAGTVLQAASFHGNMEVVRYLVDQGADVNFADGNGHTALYHAVTAGHFLVVKCLCEEGNADIEADGGFNSVSNACLLGEVECLRYLLETRGAQIRVKDFHRAIRDGHLHIVSHLCGSEDNQRFRADSQDGIDALCKASANDQVPIVEYLINEGTPVDGRNNNDFSPLAIACIYGCLETVEHLCRQGAELQAHYKVGREALPRGLSTRRTALELAATIGHFSIVAHLHEQGADATLKALHIATKLNKKQILVYLVEQAGVPLNGRDPLSGLTALQMAADGSVLPSLEYLCNQNTIEIDAPSASDLTALHLAARARTLNSVELVQTLLSKGGNPNAQNEADNSPLHLVFQRTIFTDVVVAVVASLLDAGADPLLANEQEQTPLSLALAIDDSNFVVGERKLTAIFILLRAGGLAGLME